MFRLELIVVHAEDDGEVRIILGGGAENDFLRAGIEMAGIAGLAVTATGGEDAGAFQHHVNAEGFPRQRGGILDRRDGNLLAIDNQVRFVAFDRAGVTTMGAVVLRQDGKRLGVGDVVDADDFKDVRLGH